jgi:hypothetical protein
MADPPNQIPYIIVFFMLLFIVVLLIRNPKKVVLFVTLLTLIAPNSNVRAGEVDDARPRVFLSFINKDPDHLPTGLLNLFENLIPQLGGNADEDVSGSGLPAQWSLPKDWVSIAEKGYSHFLIGKADSVTDLENKYMQITLIYGKIVKDRGQAPHPHMTFFGSLSFPDFSLWSSTDGKRLYKYVCDMVPVVDLVKNDSKCMLEFVSVSAANSVRDRLYFIFPELREKYFFNVECLQPDSEENSDEALKKTQKLWDIFSNQFAEPLTDSYYNLNWLRDKCKGLPVSSLKPEPEFEIFGYLQSKNGLDLNILNKIWSRRQAERYPWSYADKPTVLDAQKWQDQLEPLRNLECNASDSDFIGAIQRLAPHLKAAIFYRSEQMPPAPWSCKR